MTTAAGSDTVVFVEIDIPFCSKTYGVTCSAVLGVTGAIKCYQGIANCDVPLEYDPGVLTLRLARPQEGLLQYGTVFPCINGEVTTTPATINLASMNQSMSALGQRETISFMVDDFQWNDHLVDKYRLERRTGAASIPIAPFIPEQQGTFIGKFIARNPYFSNFVCRVREGVLGQALEEMRVRQYILDKIDGPTNGQATFTAKDLFSAIEARKAVAPFASQGELLADLTGTPATFTVTPAGIGATAPAGGGYASIDAVTSGHVQVGDETIQVTRVGDVFTVVQRNALGTTASDHKAEDLVQLVLSYVTTRPHDIAYNLLTTYSSIPASSIPKATWDVLAADITELYTGRITKPTPVLDLIGEICQQAGFTLWPDVSSGEVQFAALRPSAGSVTVDDDAWILDQPPISTKRQDTRRVSQVWVYYGQINPSLDLTEVRNYHSRLVASDPVAEGSQQYGAAAIRQIFSRWIPQFGRTLAQGPGQRVLAMFRDPPLEAQLSIHASHDGELVLARPFNLRTAEVQDATGALLNVLMVPIALERGEIEIGVKGQQVTFSGGGSSPLDGNNRTIFIENDSLNLNLRTVHDSLFAAPTGVETVTFIVVAGFTVGSASTGTVAMDTGDWPAGVTLNLITAGGRIQGKAGNGGAPGNNIAATPGTSGGDALKVRYPSSIDNLGGQIWAGGGGGGGGGGQTSPTVPIYVGSAGGGGCGTQAGSGSPAGVFGGVTWNAGADGTRDAGGLGGVGTTSGAGSGGKGGDGGGPGLAGQNGANATGTNAGPGAVGGTAGNYIVGNALVTWVNNGDRRGNVA